MMGGDKLMKDENLVYNKTIDLKFQDEPYEEGTPTNGISYKNDIMKKSFELFV